MPFLPVDQRFIEDFQNVAFHFGEAEAADVIDDPADQRLALGIGDDPIEKIALDGAVDAGRGEDLAGEEPPRIVLGKAHDRERDALRHDHQKRMLEPERLALDFPAIDQLQQVRPELALEGGDRV